jgi:DNA-binding NtrC family response regulator
METKCKVLLLEDNPGDARLVQEYLAESTGVRFEVAHADRVSKGEERLGKESFDVVLLDMHMPDGSGPELVLRILSQAPRIPVIVLTGTYEDDALAHQALQKGAQDYLIKGKVDGPGLTRAIRYAVERKRSQEAMETAKKELEGKVHELELLNRVMMDREERILELKEQVCVFQEELNALKVRKA